MARRLRMTSEPDLFAMTPAMPAPSPANKSPNSVGLLAKPGIRISDIVRVVPSLADDELERLRTVADDELRRRGIRPTEAVQDAARPATAEAAPRKAPQRRRAEMNDHGVAPGQASAI